MLSGCDDPVTRRPVPPLTDGDHVAIGVAIAMVVVVGAGVLVSRWPVGDGGWAARAAAWAAGLQSTGLLFACLLGTAMSFRSRQLEDLADGPTAAMPETILQITTSSDGAFWLVVLFGLPLASATASTATDLARGRSSAKTTALVLAGMAVVVGLAFAFPSSDEINVRDRIIGASVLTSGVVLGGAVLARPRRRWVPEPPSDVPGTVKLLQVLLVLLLPFPCAVAALMYLSGFTEPNGAQIAFMLAGVAGGFPLVAALGRRSKAAFVVVAVVGLSLAAFLLADATITDLPVTALLAALLGLGTLAPSSWRWFFSGEGA